MVGYPQDIFMMFLVKKNNETKICGHNELDHIIKFGYKPIKPLFDCPLMVKSMRCDRRSPKEIIKWYKTKIQELQYKIDKYNDELKLFNKIIEEK